MANEDVKQPKAIKQTYSLCPECLQVIPATIVEDCGKAYMLKICHQHGRYATLLSRDVEAYINWVRSGQYFPNSQPPTSEINKGCPYDCGLCQNHKASTCVAIIEVTSRCNLSCPVCFAASNKAHADKSLSTLRQMLNTIYRLSSSCTVQLSGGEPTVRDDLPEIAALAKTIGLEHIIVNTNGIRISEDYCYLLKLKEAGISTIFLQFDGLNDDIYQSLRGKPLLKLKIQAIENCARAEVAVVLVPTIVPKINANQIGEIIKFGFNSVHVVKGIHFQPISYFGRYPHEPNDDDRLTITDIAEYIEVQTNGAITSNSLAPRRRKEAICAFSGLYIFMGDGSIKAVTDNSKIMHSNGFSSVKGEPHLQVQKYLLNNWTYTASNKHRQSGQIHGTLNDLFSRAHTHRLSISCMAFQDVYNVDLQRLNSCCTHVVTEDQRFIPLCAFYLTSVTGERLY